MSCMQGEPNKPNLDTDATRVRERTTESPEHMQQHSPKNISAVEKSAVIKSTSLSNQKGLTRTVNATSTSSRVGPQKTKRVEAGDARLDETDFDGPISKPAAKPSLYSDDRQAENSLSPDKSAPVGDSVESLTRKNALQAKLPWPAHEHTIKKVSTQFPTPSLPQPPWTMTS
jgi:hypothetical protein